MIIKTWKERIIEQASHAFHTPEAMQAEINELRVKLDAWENQAAVATTTSTSTANFWTVLDIGTDLYTKPKEL
jgi:hypothetical protein